MKGLRPSPAHPCLWVVLNQLCGGDSCVLCAAVDQLGPACMWTDEGGRHVMTIELDTDDPLAAFFHVAHLEGMVDGLKATATDYGEGTLLLFRCDADAA